MAAYSCGGSCGIGAIAPHRIPVSPSEEGTDDSYKKAQCGAKFKPAELISRTRKPMAWLNCGAIEVLKGIRCAPTFLPNCPSQAMEWSLALNLAVKASKSIISL
jgi:hypothetical protein